MKASVIAVSAALLLTSCVTAPQGPTSPLPTSRTFSQPFDKVWGTVVSEVSADCPIQSIEKASGLLTTRDVSLGDGFTGQASLYRYGYAPRILLATWTGGARCSLSFYVSSSDSNSTTLRVTARIEGFEDNVTKSWQPWESNGVLENQYLDKISGAIPVAAAPPPTATQEVFGPNWTPTHMIDASTDKLG